jgi:hypothetical protein
VLVAFPFLGSSVFASCHPAPFPSRAHACDSTMFTLPCAHHTEVDSFSHAVSSCVCYPGASSVCMSIGLQAVEAMISLGRAYRLFGDAKNSLRYLDMAIKVWACAGVSASLVCT